jgi:hypothetical protein
VVKFIVSEKATSKPSTDSGISCVCIGGGQTSNKLISPHTVLTSHLDMCACTHVMYMCMYEWVYMY